MFGLGQGAFFFSVHVVISKTFSNSEILLGVSRERALTINELITSLVGSNSVNALRQL